MLATTLITAFSAGISTHFLYFRRGEHHDHAPHLASLIPISWCSIFTFLAQTLGFGEAARTTTLLLSTFVAGVFISVIIYRLFFHPLRSFPGPILAAVTKFWHCAKLSNLQNQELLESLHQKYRNIVRIGPNEVAVFRADGVPVIHGPGSKCTKAPWYDMLLKDRSIHATRKPHIHQARRKIWDQGFGMKALRSYQERVNKHVERLSENIDRRISQPINCTQLFLFFGFDVMGDTAFGSGFGMLESNKEHPIVQIMRGGIYIIGRLTPVPWLITILSSLPGGNGDFKKLEAFAEESILKRAKMERGEDDVMSKLIAAARSPSDPEKIDMHFLGGDAMVIIIAGSDTVSIALTFLFYHLALIPEHMKMLREELEGIDITENRALQPLIHLNALINETLRLYPPVITAPLRYTRQEGIRIGNNFIPGNVTISTPLWSLGRLESSYERATEFLPERWYPGSDMVKDIRGFVPFMSGAHSCLGKQLALMELRLVIAKLVTRYDLSFLDAERKHETVSDIKDCFTALPGPLNLVFKRRGETRGS
ncbi:cytochrome P450 monooxygenase-like protein [Byssothecium circinans]|uniref:Cytochrome P450 monooxygenase-like protein n=1 Tax=Byssothecium circinans TaxID=147558 RepID=A0A6A5U0G3_9PLEO|nr:cytochrome P450 monooxygenase-like protein [Byssothecium circinans]